MSRLIDADKLHYVQMLVQNPNNGKHKHMVAVRAKEINKAPTVDAIPREQIDEMITEIKERFDTHGIVSLYNKAIHDVLDIIHKYCDKENKDV